MEHGAIPPDGPTYQTRTGGFIQSQYRHASGLLQSRAAQGQSGGSQRLDVWSLKVGEFERRLGYCLFAVRFVVGDYEEKDYSVRSSRANTFYRQHTNDPSDSGRSRSWSSSRPHTFYHVVMRALRAYRHIIQKIKCFDRHQTCPHPFSCVYYTIQVFFDVLQRSS